MSLHFPFIIPRAPEQFPTPLREFLWNETVRSLVEQEYNTWTAIVVGETEPLGDGRFIFIEYDLVEKRQKLCFALDYIKAMDQTPYYLIRLYDDDIISKSALNTWEDLGAYCLAARYHSIMEILSGKISGQKGIGNTMAHKTEHVIHLMDNSDPLSYLLVQDHSKAWHLYYAGKRIA